MRLLRRLTHLLRLGSNGADLARELAFHREMIEREYVNRGMSPAEARDAARRAMGNETLMREESRAVWVWASLEAVWHDAKYTARGLARNPAFTLGVTITLALGIGANAAMFSLVDRLLFRPPAFMIDPESAHRVYLFRTIRGTESQTGFPYKRYAGIAKGSTAFSQIAGFAPRQLAVGTGDATRVMTIGVVSASFFRFFDAPPLLGRYFVESEDTPPDGAPVAVLSSSAWKSEFGSRKDVLGSTVHIGAVTYTVIGVAPDGFVGLWPYRPPAAFIPLAMYGASEGGRGWASNYGHQFGLSMMVRRKPNVSIDAATADLTNAFYRDYQSQLNTNPGTTPITVSRPRALAGSILSDRGPERSSAAQIATWLSGVTIIVLLIACANVANLLLARTVRRRREVAVRVALGVSRVRLFSQLLTEGMVLAMLGGVAGLIVAVWGGGVLRSTFLPGTERVSLITDPRTLLFAGAIALGVGVLTGLVPMLQAGRLSLTNDLKSGARDGTYQRARLRTLLLLIQSALSVVLLVGAGLFVRSLRNVRDVHLGFDADPVLLVRLNTRDMKLDSASTVALRLRLLETAKTIPGVSHATLQESIPFGGTSSYRLYVSGVDSVDALGTFEVNTVSPEYFATMSTRILRGRGIESTDISGAQRVAVIGEAMGRALWPEQDAIGRCFRVSVDTMPCTYVVGIAEDIHTLTIEPESKQFLYYLSALQWHPEEGGLFVRTQGDASRLLETVRGRLQREMPGTSFITVSRLSDKVDTAMRSWTLGATVFTAFGALALVLAAVGLYSVIAYSVAQRKHELGVRLALGAGRARVVRLVMIEGLGFALGGALIGGVIAFAAGKWVGPLLFNVSPRDPAVFAVVISSLLAVAAVASSIPALRAASVDPKAALQAE